MQMIPISLLLEMTRNNLIHKGNYILKAVNEFMKSNLLHINLDKCYYTHFALKL